MSQKIGCASCGYLLVAPGVPGSYNKKMSYFTNRSEIRKVGNSLGILLPLKLLRAIQTERGDQVIITVSGPDTLTITKVPLEFKERMIRA